MRARPCPSMFLIVLKNFRMLFRCGKAWGHLTEMIVIWDIFGHESQRKSA